MEDGLGWSGYGILEMTHDDMNKHAEAEDTEDDVSLPANVDEAWGHKCAESGVKGPVGGCRQRHGLSTYAKRVKLRWIDPGNRSPRWSEAGNEKVRAGDEAFGRGAGKTHADSLNTTNASWNDLAMCSEDTGVGEHPGHHQRGADDHCGTTSPAIEPDQGRHGHQDVDDVLDR